MVEYDIVLTLISVTSSGDTRLVFFGFKFAHKVFLLVTVSMAMFSKW